ncbi:hypothetical protein [Sphaerospermopsis aphanizomenoides]|uniref:hypothetical protein n=1 Tax=Sphaerospermopsis aphanizomenoides TaxID=459663 RepID=UPI0019058A52|nr:hypothetical protein [Sphaerospermopsis aphanizomenoides]
MRNLALVSLAAFLGTAATFAISKDVLAINATQTLLSQQNPSPNISPSPSPTVSPRTPRTPRTPRGPR